jgi:hypothetical protein
MVKRRKYTRNKKRAKRRTRLRHRGGASPTISFISYGNDPFKAAKERLQKEAEAMGVFNGKIRMYSPEDLSAEFKEAVGPTLNEARGGGYWLWKPYIIKDMLTQLNEDDILLYVDCGCTLQPKGAQRIKEYAEMISKASGKSILGMELPFKGSSWTSSAIFDHFGVTPEDERWNSNQILGGTHMYRKCKESLDFIDAWLDIAMNHPRLFTDDDNEESKRRIPGFRENRHDQSIFTILIKSPPHKGNAHIINEEIELSSEYLPKPDSSILPIIASRKKE